jgi:purine-nucleoside phosphorylase
MQEVVFPTRTLGRLGVKTQIITNAAGGIDPKMSPGHLMIIEDHINLTGDNPLRGGNISELGPRFPDMTNPFHPKYIQRLNQIMDRQNVPHSTGVYCGVQGPTYETAAEVRYLQKIGGHAVGMSTVPEVIAARHMGIDIVGISCITNLATGISKEKISHSDVTIVAKKVEKSFIAVLTELIATLN